MNRAWLRGFTIVTLSFCAFVGIIFFIVEELTPTPAERQAAAQRAAARERQQAQQQAMGPNRPGTPPKEPLPVHAGWFDINSEGCDLTYTVLKGTVELDGKAGSYSVDVSDKQIGRKAYKVMTRIRATNPEGEAEVYFMLCQPGTGPTDGSWRCNVSSTNNHGIGFTASVGVNVH